MRAGGEELAAGRPAVALRRFREALDHSRGPLHSPEGVLWCDSVALMAALGNDQRIDQTRPVWGAPALGHLVRGRLGPMLRWGDHERLWVLPGILPSPHPAVRWSVPPGSGHGGPG